MKAKDVVAIFQSNYSEEVYDRKAREVSKFMDERSTGFAYNELKELTQLATHMLYDISKGHVREMKAPFIQLLKISKKGFRKERIFDDRIMFAHISEFLNTLSPILYDFNYLIDIDNSFEESKVPAKDLLDIKFAVIEFLYEFLKEDIDKLKDTKRYQARLDKEAKEMTLAEKKKKQSLQNEAEDKKYEEFKKNYLNENLKTEGTKNFRALHNSDLPEALVYFLQHNSNNYLLNVLILEVLNMAVMYNQLVKKFCGIGLLKDIIYHLFDKKDEFRSYPVRLSFEIMWNSIETLGREAVENIATEDIVFSLRELFLDIMSKGYKLEDKCLRNELLILINYIFTFEEMIPFMIENRGNKSTHQGLSELQRIRGPKLSDDNLKNLNFLEILIYFATIDENIFSQGPANSKEVKPVFGLTTEDLEFKKLILSGILLGVESGNKHILELVGNSNFIQSMLDYIHPLSSNHAVIRWSAPQLREIQLHCLNILSNLIVHMKDYFYQKDGLFCLTKFLTNSNDHDKKEKCLRAFVNASVLDEEYKLKISDVGVIDVLLDLIGSDTENIEIKELCYSIISNLCQGCNKNKKQFRSKGGVDLIIQSLKNPDIIMSERNALYTLAVLDCLWNAVLGNKKSESLFLDNEGFYVLMEFIEACDEIHRKLSLTCLSQLVENPKTAPYFDDWNSIRTMRNSSQLLVKLYEEEENKYQVEYRDGVLQNLNRPLNPSKSQIESSRKIQRKLMSEEEETTQGRGAESQNPVGASTGSLSREQLAITAKKTQTKLNSTLLPSINPGKSGVDASGNPNEADSEVGAEAYLIRMLREKTKLFDLRGIIFAILYRTGFDRNELTPQEKQRIEMIQIYPQMRIGEIWSDIRDDLQSRGIKPTSEDAHWMLTNIEEFQELVLKCVNTQRLIARENRKQQEDDLNKFFDIIRSNKAK